MLDFIFIIGASGIGKSTLAQGLLNKYKTVVIEQNMVPEFISRDGSEEMTGELEELTCWENTKAMALCFRKLGYKNIIVSDLDDLRTADIPIDFKGYRYVTLKLVCSDVEQLKKQMRDRPEGGLIDYELQKKSNEKISSRDPLINEYVLDVTGLDISRVVEEAVHIIESSVPLTEYEYVKPEKGLFYSWVFSNGLR
ncbi:MAG: hypothetical protein J6A85_05270 [Clostridia bacterium]|nr:hypothetical protein [Clostridia bacterium]